MPNRRLMLQLTPEGSEIQREISETIEKSGGTILPAPLIFPIVIHFIASEEVAKEFKEKYNSSIARTMTDTEAEEE